MKNTSKYADIEKKIRGSRHEYRFGTLRRKDLAKNPWDQFSSWFQNAVTRAGHRANVMTLATGAGGKISIRSVLMKGFGETGLLFHTNFNSRKAAQLKANSRAAACFYWPESERQVTLIGKAKKISRAEAKKYFESRPREAQIAAWCGRQSSVIRNREELDEKFKTFSKKFEGRPVPFPSDWGGYRLQPDEFEFWQGRENRLNDRFRYRRVKNSWLIERLAP